MDNIVKEISVYGDVVEYGSLATCTTLRIGGTARVIIYPKNELSLSRVLDILVEAKVPFKVFGKGSNILCSDDFYDGVIIRLDRYFTDFYFDETSCYAQAGCSIIALSYEAMKKGLSGLEFTSGIPATVGGVTYMNAGAYKGEMSQVIKRVYVYKDGQYVWLRNDECEFSYRHSIFQKHPDWVVVAIEVQLEPKDTNEIRNLIDDRRARRLATQPLDYPSAGSVFKNPENNLSWKIIDAIGYRGKRIGGAQVSEKHSNFIINVDHASAHDFYQLVTEIQTLAKEKCNEDLFLEVEKFNWHED